MLTEIPDSELASHDGEEISKIQDLTHLDRLFEQLLIATSLDDVDFPERDKI